MDDRQGKGTALVTGTSSGIGAAFARKLAREGYDLILVARRGDKLKAQAERLKREAGIKAEVLVADLSNSADLRRVENRLVSEENLTLLVNNAGLGPQTPFVETPMDVVESVIAVNITALVSLTHAALPGMLARGKGAIINVASGLAYAVMANSAVYGATKSFVAHFTELLHEEVGTRGIRLQVLVPGLTRTNLGGAEATGFFDRFPKGTVMEPDDLVDASLASLAMGELFCFPRLEDPERWSRASQAIRDIGKSPLSDKPAARYRLGKQS